MEALEWQLLGVLSLPHWLYAFIWLRPKAFMALCGRAEPVETMYRLATALKGARARGRGSAARHARGRGAASAALAAARSAADAGARSRLARAALQFASVFFWATAAGPLNLLAVPPARLAAALVMGGIGQARSMAGRR
jgi:hypothetical protein